MSLNLTKVEVSLN